MVAATKPKRTLVGIELLRLLSREGDRIFTTDRARELAPQVGLRESYLLECLYHLRQNGWIVPLRRGLYAMSSSSIPGVADAHEFEIAMSLVSPAAISHWSAIHHHGLTEQIPRTVFVTTTTETSVPRKRNSTCQRVRAGIPHRRYSLQIHPGEAAAILWRPERLGRRFPRLGHRSGAHAPGWPEYAQALRGLWRSASRL